MSASPSTTTAPSQKRPLEDPSSPSGPTDQPDAKRPALDKVVSDEVTPGTAHVSIADDAAPSADVVASTTAATENGTKPDTTLPDAPHLVAATEAAGGVVPQTTHPIQTTTTNNDHASQSTSQTAHQDESTWIHIRAVITSAEAATVIGKGGENVTQIRKLSGAKCTVSDYSRGAVERILTVSGLVDAAAKVSPEPRRRLSTSILSFALGLWFDHPYP